MNNREQFLIDKATQIVAAAIHSDKPKKTEEIVTMFNAIYEAVSAKAPAPKAQ